MANTLKIGISKEIPQTAIVGCHIVSLREKLLRRLFGEKTTLTIIVPSNKVQSLTINEEGGEPYGENERA